jgi:hypothetical protein
MEKSPNCRTETRKMFLIGEMEKILGVITEGEELSLDLVEMIRCVARGGWEEMMCREFVFVVRVKRGERF